MEGGGAWWGDGVVEARVLKVFSSVQLCQHERK